MNNNPSYVQHSLPPRTSGLAITSLVLGITSILGCVLLTGIPAIICGHMAQSRIRKSGGTLEGNGLAIGGLIAGYCGIALTIVVAGMLAAIAIPNFVRARDTVQRNICMNHLRILDGAKHQWAVENERPMSATPTEDEVRRYLTDQQFPVCPAGGTYTLHAVGETPTCSVEHHQLD